MTTQLVLTDEQLDEICTVARTDWAQAVVLTFKAFGIDLTDPTGERVDPTHYQIPGDQWRAIAEACGADKPSDVPNLARVNHMLDWMNYSPSSYEPEEAMA